MNWYLLESIFFLIVSSFGLLTIGLLLFSIRSNKYVNTYLLLVLILGLSRAILYGTYSLNIQRISNDISPPYKGIVIISFVLFYLYFKTLASDERRFNPRHLLHFILPILFSGYYLLVNVFGMQEERYILVINFSLTSIFILVYLFLTFKLVATQIWRNPQKVHEQHYLTIRNWSIFLFVVFLVGTLKVLVFNVVSFSKGELLSHITLGFTGASLQLVLFIKLLISPEILLGIPRLNKRLSPKTNSVEFKNNEFWKLDVKEVTGPLDERLKEKLDESILELIEDVEEFVNEKRYFRNHHITIKELANEMEVPYTHIIYLFKYHCKLTFTEYKTIKRIEDAKHLISLGFLKHNTLESLATEVGYASYNPFFTSFKKIVGMSPNDFATRGSGY
jgi:AraC-like DNA-binding protein